MKLKALSFVILAGLLATACATAPAAAPVAEQQSPAEAPAAEQAPAEAPAQTAPTEAAPAEAAVDEVSFGKDIWPVLEQFAVKAHGGKGGVFLESYDDVLKYVVPGKPEESMLYKRLTGDGVPVMPPSGKLPDATIKLFFDWILQGAKNN